MSFLDWRPIYSVGVNTIDQEHQKLIGFMNQFLDHHMAKKSADAVTSLQALLGYTQVHFADEERLMATCHYPDLANHQQAHIRLLESVRKLAAAYGRENSTANAEALAKFLKSWLVNHILGVDKQYSSSMIHHGIQ